MNFLSTVRKLWARPVTPGGPDAVKQNPGAQIAPKAGEKVMEYEVIATGERFHIANSDAVRALVATGQLKPEIGRAHV